MIIGPAELLAALPRHPRDEVAVFAGPSNTLAFFASRHEAVTLTKNGAIHEGVVHKNQGIRYLRLSIGVRAARRLIGRQVVKTLNAPSGAITKPHKPNGAPEWAPRFDRAHTGRFSQVRRIFSDHQQHRASA